MFLVTKELSTPYFACKWGTHVHTHVSIVACSSCQRAEVREENVGEFLSGLLPFDLILTMHPRQEGSSVGIISGIQGTDAAPHASLWAPCTGTPDRPLSTAAPSPPFPASQPFCTGMPRFRET